MVNELEPLGYLTQFSTREALTTEYSFGSTLTIVNLPKHNIRAFNSRFHFEGNVGWGRIQQLGSKSQFSSHSADSLFTTQTRDTTFHFVRQTSRG